MEFYLLFHVYLDFSTSQAIPNKIKATPNHARKNPMGVYKWMVPFPMVLTCQPAKASIPRPASKAITPIKEIVIP